MKYIIAVLAVVFAFLIVACAPIQIPPEENPLATTMELPELAIPTVEPTEEVSSASAPESTATPTPAPQCDTDNCWRKDDADKKITWTGYIDGRTDIRQDGEYLALVREGWSALFGMSVPWYLEWCKGVVLKAQDDGSFITVHEMKNGCQASTFEEEIAHFEPGLYRIEQSIDNDGGFRASPEEGYGWRKTSSGCDTCWEVDTTQKTITWIGTYDGTVRVDTTNMMIVSALRQGYTAVLPNVPVPGLLDFCIGRILVDGKEIAIRDNCTESALVVGVGEIKVEMKDKDGNYFPNMYFNSGFQWEPSAK